jgi:hypothetical protein
MEIINESLGLCNDNPEHQGCYGSSKFVILQVLQNRVKLTTVLVRKWGEIWHNQCESSLQPSGLPGCRFQPEVAIGREEPSQPVSPRMIISDNMGETWAQGVLHSVNTEKMETSKKYKLE